MESPGAPRRRRAVPSRSHRPLLCTALAVHAVAGATAGGTVCVRAGTHPGTAAVTSPEPSASGEAVGPVGEPTTDYDAVLGAALASVDVPDGARVSVAVLDVGSGARAVYGDAAFDTAGIVKVDILAALLLRAQDAGRQLTAREKAYATAMIEHSDNASASALWDAVGRAEGLDAANARLGLTATSGGEGAPWGLTRTTAADQLALLRQVFGDPEDGASALAAASRAYLQGPMERIAVGQRWGGSAAADGSAWALKNGWLPRSTTGRWDVSSIGRITAGGRTCLVAVLSSGTAAQEDGIALVESAARAAVTALAGAAEG
ncbi:serine hydrolase [Streptomyces longwoodensis]|uniref:serine hydrolase n=1 Tax=Streptomyces longwoodensis TaxID=68231 RepID=UPI0033CF6C85